MAGLCGVKAPTRIFAQRLRAQKPLFMSRSKKIIKVLSCFFISLFLYFFRGVVQCSQHAVMETYLNEYRLIQISNVTDSVVGHDLHRAPV